MTTSALDVLVVGAGFAGSVLAERLASAGRQVLVIDRREHIGGNAFDETDAHGVLVHRYGPHIFHTQSSRVFAYLSRFTSWRPYEHRVQALVEGRFYPIPINRTTINSLYGLDLDEAGVAAYLASVAEPRDEVLTSEDAVLASVGRDLCDKFFRGYTRKQWGLELNQLAASVAARIPTRSNDDDRYFTDRHQAMPAQGYTRMFTRMLGHPRIRVETGVDYFAERQRWRPRLTVFSGPIDAYFDYRHGALPYRSLEFRHEHHDLPRYQHTGTVNFPNDHAYTRITEFKYLTGQDTRGTSIVKEFPRADGDPYYPIPNPDNESRYQRYKALARDERDVVFVGRLAQYRYYNMDQVVAAALKAARDVTGIDDEYTSLDN
ncbi:MAG: UDP-galactopyranose mutase [Proteobacteria bacterium]|nr:UDP-galactopyranose mutase [Pseudomonadota bacterium]